MLLSLALSHTGRIPQKLPCCWLFRDKSLSYFNEVNKNGGIERTYNKDHNGDPANCINGQIRGLFFSTNVSTNPKTYGQPRTPSLFGDTRLLIPAGYFLNDECRLYFADFYCLSGHKAHWVTLVHTRSGSDADQFCSKKLIELDIKHNAFLGIGPACFWTAAGVCVELLHTEDIDYNKLRHTGGVLGRVAGTNGRHGGKTKTSGCKICNVKQSNLEKAHLQEL